MSSYSHQKASPNKFVSINSQHLFPASMLNFILIAVRLVLKLLRDHLAMGYLWLKDARLDPNCTTVYLHVMFKIVSTILICKASKKVIIEM